jgi:hypothetical protein
MIDQQLKDINTLREIARKYGYVAMLWHVDDVTDNYDVTDEDAYDILEEALDSSGIHGTIYDAIDMICERDEIEQKEDI